MLDISVEYYKNAEVHTMTIGTRRLFWIGINDVQKRLGIKNICDLVTKGIHGIFEARNPTKKQIRKNERPGKE